MGNASGDRIGCHRVWGHARLRGCCNLGVRTTDMAPVFVSSSTLAAGRDKGSVEARTLSLYLLVETKTGASRVV